ncbi:hypothetical protein [Blastopirellula marina]|uniref:Uncharacterized protein n=1 Tax=Blastopirellula marina TaxID=124 RepID=A0A2S8GNQ4_9BACT|nr:hypothetical protein [Blastopirellula marina]PQO46048.1 hypothetical protein C5Y93_10745 [Blastopirellula marina]
MTKIPIDGKLLRGIRKSLKVPNRNYEEFGAWGLSYHTVQRAEREGLITDESLSIIITEMLKRASELDKVDPLPQQESHTSRTTDSLVEIMRMAGDRLIRSQQALGKAINSPAELNVLAVTMQELLESGRVQAMADSFRGEAELADEKLRTIQKATESAYVRSLKDRGDNWARNGQYSKAIQVYRQANQIDPDDLEAQLRIAESLLSLRIGDPVQNLKESRRLLSFKIPKSSSLWADWTTCHGIATYRDTSLSVSKRLAGSAKHFIAATKHLQDSGKLFRAATPASHLGIVVFRQGLAIFSHAGNQSSGAAAAKFKQAHEMFEFAIKQWNKLDFPYLWALGKKRLGNYWQLLPEVEPSARRRNLDNALRNYQGALELYKDKGFVLAQAQLLFSMSDLHLARAKTVVNGTSKHYRRAVDTCIESLDLLTREHREDWAYACYNLADAYLSNPSVSESQIEKAIDLLKNEVLPVYHRRFDETEWSDTHFRLAEAYQLLAERRSFDRNLIVLAISSIKGACAISDLAYPALQSYRQRLKELKNIFVLTLNEKPETFDVIEPPSDLHC